MTFTANSPLGLETSPTATILTLLGTFTYSIFTVIPYQLQRLSQFLFKYFRLGLRP
jgi:hypothetical protein